MKKFTAVSILCLGLLLFSSSLPVMNNVLKDSNAATRTSITFGLIINSPTTFFQVPSNWIVTGDTEFPYLFPYRYGLAGTPEPGLTSIPVAVPGTNDSSWIVNLRYTNYKWSDGFPLNSTDMAYSFGVYLYKGPFANLSTYDLWGHMRKYIANISIVNSTAIRMNAFASFPQLVVSLWFYAIYPYHYFKQFNGTNVLQKASIVGGPGDTAYIPDNYIAGATTMKLVANPLSPSWNGTTPTIQTVTYQFFTSENALVSALAAGTIDGADITPSDVQALSSTAGLKIDRVPSIYAMTVYIEPALYPLNVTAFRQGLMYLLPKYQIDQTLYNGTAPVGNAAQIIGPTVPLFWPSGAANYNYSTANAMSSFKTAGLTQDSSGKWMLPNGTAASVDIEAANNDPDIIRAAQLYTTSLQNAGLQANLRLTDIATVTGDVYTSGQYQIAILPNHVFSVPFRWMANPTNFPLKWQNATFANLYRQAVSATDQTHALQLIKQAITVVADQAIMNDILYEPEYAAYNIRDFASWQPAIDNAKNYQYFTNEFMSENVLTAIRPVGSTASTSSQGTTTTTSTSAVVSSTTTSASSGSALSLSPLVVGAALGVLIVVSISLVLAKRRTRSHFEKK